LSKKTNFLFGSTLIENLIPQKYDIAIKKQGYQSWEKNLEVKEKQVTEAKSIVLFPEDPAYSILYENIDDFWFSADGKKVILKEKDSQTSTAWSLKMYNIANGVKSQLITDKEIYKNGSELFDVNFSSDQNQLYIKIGSQEQIKNFTLNLADNSLSQNLATSSTPANVIAKKESENKIYFLDEDGYIYESDTTYVKNEKINSQAFQIDQETDYNLYVFADQFFIKKGQTLYKLNSKSGTFEKFFDSLKGLILSPDSQKIAYYSNSEIWITFLRDNFEQPQTKTGEKIFLNRFSEKIDNIFWINSNYLIFSIGNAIKISEIDDRDKINIFNFGTFESPKLFFNNFDKKLYALSESSLSYSVNLIP
jgi:hypothetical protein